MLLPHSLQCPRNHGSKPRPAWLDKIEQTSENIHVCSGFELKPLKRALKPMREMSIRFDMAFAMVIGFVGSFQLHWKLSRMQLIFAISSIVNSSTSLICQVSLLTLPSLSDTTSPTLIVGPFLWFGRWYSRNWWARYSDFHPLQKCFNTLDFSYAWWFTFFASSVESITSPFGSRMLGQQLPSKYQIWWSREFVKNLTKYMSALVVN